MKELINKIIQDLGDEKPISGILLKSQIVASELGNQEFSNWIFHEQNGYTDVKSLPDYRKLGAIVKVDVTVPFQGRWTNITLPNGVFGDEKVNEIFFQTQLLQSLTEIETLCKGKEKGSLTCSLPAIAYIEANKVVRGNVERVWQECSTASALHIVDVFKSKLLDFFLKLNKEIEGGIDFSQISGQEKINQIMNNTFVNATIANMGSGSIQTGDVSCNSTNMMTVSPKNREEMQEIVGKLSDIVSSIDNDDLHETLATINDEISKPNWCKKTLKMAFNALGGIATGIAANIATNQVAPLVAQALALL